MNTNFEETLRRARAAQRENTAESLALYEVVVRDSRDHTWGEAQVELAAYFLAGAELERAIERADAVLGASSAQVSFAATGRAGVLRSAAESMLGGALNEHLLRTSIDACLQSEQPYYAAVGLAHLAEILRQSERTEEATRALEQAVALYDRSGSMLGGPQMLTRLADHAWRTGERDAALEFVDRALAHVQKFPLGGILVRNLERKLVELRRKLAGGEPPAAAR